MTPLPITVRLLLSYLLVAALPLVGLTAMYLVSFEAALRETVLTNMETIANKKAEEIETYMAERLTNVQQLSQRASLREAIAAFGQAFRQAGLTSPQYLAAEGRFRRDLRNDAEQSGFYDLMLIDTAGNVVFAVAREADLGTNLKSGPYRETQLAKGFDLAMRTLQPQLTRFAPYAPSGMRVAAFLVAPVLNHGIPVAALALQVDISRLESLTGDRTGLGLTGETVLAVREGDEVLYTAFLKHRPDAAYRYRVALKNAALPMQEALAGGHGRGVVRDYAGVECVAAWRYLPALRWGMKVKIDIEEALVSVTRQRRITMATLLVFLIGSGLVAYVFGRRLSHPIQELTDASERIARGDLSCRVPQGGGDEVGRLSAAFNGMADALAEARRDLESKVEARTRELRESEARLQAAQVMAQVGNWELDLKTNRLYWSDEVFQIFEIDKAHFEVSYEAFLEAVHPDDRAMVSRAYTLSGANPLPHEIVHRLQMPDGRVKYVQGHCEISYDAEGRPCCSVGTVQDITERRLAEIQVERALQEKEMLLREVHHRVKNNLQLVSSLLYFQAKKIRNSEDLAVFREGQDRLQSMIMVHEKLYRSGDLACIEAGDYVQVLVDGIRHSYERLCTKVEIVVDAARVTLPVEIALPVGMMVTELLTNALKYAFPRNASGVVRVRLTAGDGRMELAVEDTGVGLTAGIDVEQPATFGLQLVQGLVRKLSGTVTFEGRTGTVVRVSVPLPVYART